MCLICFRQVEIKYECRRCRREERRLSLYHVRPCTDAADLCGACCQFAIAEDLCLRCLQQHCDHRQGSELLCTLCKQRSTDSSSTPLLGGDNCRKCNMQLALTQKPSLDGLCHICDQQLRDNKKCVSCFVATRRRECKCQRRCRACASKARLIDDLAVSGSAKSYVTK